ncbi:transposase [Fictibacillus phosphorivorans]|uniref:transposase n=1 Tax=Fictibacillus phosphorivorans TaxID=1221500 RepID=UPI0020423F2B|nr:transposase [Fictibacillus phosphorivorans]MCM3718516.1 transposase [Fictibacillus phosphorivorans]MCM3776128.1 transposase [Fictibacillus phosphorivorans]
MIEYIYTAFPDDNSYKKYLFNLRWNKHIICPFCSSIKNTKTRSNFRFHCNVCNTNYSLTANTVMHDTKVELRKWLITIYFYLHDEQLSYRKLSKVLKVNKNTAFRMITSLQNLFSKERLTILEIAG